MILIKRQRYAVEVKQRLLQQILTGEILPGRRIVELDVAAALGVSQAAVREALLDLESVGLISSEFYRGSRVRVISAGEIDELHTIRASLETQGARLAVAHFKEWADTLRDILTRAEAAVQGKDRSSFLSLEREFRGAVITMSKSRPLNQLWRPISLQLELAEQQHRMVFKVRKSQELLCEVVRAFENQDGERAGRLLSRCTHRVASPSGMPSVPLITNASLTEEAGILFTANPRSLSFSSGMREGRPAANVGSHGFVPSVPARQAAREGR